MTTKISIIGSGVVGTAIGVILGSQGYEIAGVYDARREAVAQLVEKTGCRTFLNPEEAARAADVIFITCNDSAISEVADILADKGSIHCGQTVIHTSGAHSAAILDRAKECGAKVVSVHPLQSFANLDAAVVNLPGSVFSIEGDREAYDIAVELVKALGGEYFFIDSDAKPLYHAGACVVSNYLVTLIDLGGRLLEKAGIPAEQAHQALMPLVRGTLNNIEKTGIPRALTGPIARGDIATVSKHLACLESVAEEQNELYRRLGYHTIPIARAKGSINGDTVREFQELLDPHKDMQR